MDGVELIEPPVRLSHDPGGLFRENYVPLDWATEYHRSREWAWVRVAAGGAGSGKTHTNKTEFLYMAYLYGGQWIAIAQSLLKSRSIQFEEILKVMSPRLIERSKITRQPELSITIPARNNRYARMKFEGADEGNIKAEGKKRGIEVEGFWFTEVTTVLNELIDAQLHLRTRMSKKPRALYDTNPEGPDNWLLDEYFPKGQPPVLMHLSSHWREGTRIDKSRGVYWQGLTIKHNHLQPKETMEKNIERAKPESGFWYRRMILGHWVAPEGSVYCESANSLADHVVLDD